MQMCLNAMKLGECGKFDKSYKRLYISGNKGATEKQTASPKLYVT